MTNALPFRAAVLPYGKPWIVGFWILIGAAIGQAYFGEAFYKVHIGPLFLSELAVLAAWFGVAPGLAQRLALPNVPWLRLFIGLSFAYLVYSLVADRNAYWIIRQSVFIFYATVGCFSYVVFRYHRAQLPLRALFRGATAVGGIGMILSFLDVLPFGGNTDYTSTLMFLTGLAYWITRAPSLGAKIAIGAAGTALVAGFNGHSSFMPGAALILFLSMFLHFPAVRAPLVLMGAIVAVFASGANEQYSDANALWRYRYWHAILQDSWERGLFLLGKGFGVQYLPANAAEFEKIISQVSTIDMPDRAFQLMTVPPHNGLLTILIYIGLPGIVLFLAPMVLGLVGTLRRRASLLTTSFTLACWGMLVLMMTNQSLEFPYVAIYFWLVYGALLACHQEDRQSVALQRLDVA